MNEKRVRILKKRLPGSGPVIYWMSRDQRVSDNWALIFAAQLAREHKKPLVVVFHLLHEYAGASYRHYLFMINGLREVEQRLRELRIPFVVTTGESGLIHFFNRIKIGILVTDFDPLRMKRQWKKKISALVDIPVFEVDAHNTVPCWIASGKQEYGAYTFRPKIHKLLPVFLDPFPELQKQSPTMEMLEHPDWSSLTESLQVPPFGPAVHINPGETAAKKQLENFLESGLHLYSERRNDPSENGTSGFSPWLHFGHISAQRIALEILRRIPAIPGTETFLEQLLVRKELADNFCFYNDHYDSFEGFPEWAQKTLNRHRNDEREYLYSEEDLENSRTHDELWNAAQMEMVVTGKMHNYMRMYWAKKILEWTPSPEEALRIAIKLNDRYELDGRDPNGYTGCAWAIGGVHDRPWGERPVFGTIRYMNFRGAARKFDINTYIRKVQSIAR